jgi:hypothetical protein
MYATVLADGALERCYALVRFIKRKNNFWLPQQGYVTAEDKCLCETARECKQNEYLKMKTRTA